MKADFTINTLIMILAIFFLQVSCEKDDSNDNWVPGDDWIDTRDGQPYATVRIGAQVWMAENLRAKHYSDGTAIQYVKDGWTWQQTLGSTDKAYCYYDYNPSYGDNYGALYTWAAAMNGVASSNSNPSGIQGVCPDGWHLPSDAEWSELIDYLGGYNKAGGKMKESGYTHWNNPNNGADNLSSFSALPGGYNWEGFFYNVGRSALFWSSNDSSEYAWLRLLTYGYSGVYHTTTKKNYGLSVRCLRD